MKLIIIRGPSGSGKSTLASVVGGQRGLNWFEADMFFERDGKYQFDPRKLGQAHVWCQTKVIEALMNKEADYDTVIVSNTSTTISEVETYIEIANRANVVCEIIRTPGPWNVDELLDQNKHNVPRVVLQRQVVRYTSVATEREWNDLSIFNGVK